MNELRIEMIKDVLIDIECYLGTDKNLEKFITKKLSNGIIENEYSRWEESIESIKEETKDSGKQVYMLTSFITSAYKKEIEKIMEEEIFEVIGDEYSRMKYRLGAILSAVIGQIDCYEISVKLFEEYHNREAEKKKIIVKQKAEKKRIIVSKKVA